MIRLPFIWRLYASFVAVILILATLSSVIGSRRVRTQALDTMRATLLDESRLLRHLMEPGNSERLDELRSQFAETGRLVSVRITLIGPDGLVWADSDRDASQMENHADRPEILEATEREYGFDVRYSATLGREMMYMAVAVRDGSRLQGFVRSSLPLRLVESRIEGLRNSIILAAVIAGTIALLGAWFFARKVTEPLRDMTLAAQSIAAGDYDQNLHASTRDEIGNLAVAFNRMSTRLRKHVDTIEADRNKIMAILRSMREAVIAIDLDERIVHINHAAGSMLQIDVSSAVGLPLQEVIRNHQLGDALRAVLRSGRGENSELRIRGALRDQILELQSSPLLGNQNELAGALLVLSDTSELRRLESVRSEFVSNVSHEMKTPVAAIRGLVESVLDDPQMQEETRTNFLRRAEQQCKRLSDLVSDLLGLAAAERGAGLELRDVELNGICEHCIAQYRDDASEHGLSMDANIPNAPLIAYADSEAVRLILDNLLSNAIRYTPDGGKITLRLQRNSDRAQIEIQDTGIGIEPEQQERVFERFYRVDRARSRELGGTGLGLAIVKHLVQAMDGDIQLESSPGSGSLFRVLLPLKS